MTGEKRTIWNDIEMGGGVQGGGGVGVCVCVCVKGCRVKVKVVGGAQLFLGTKPRTVATGVRFVDGWA